MAQGLAGVCSAVCSPHQATFVKSSREKMVRVHAMAYLHGRMHSHMHMWAC